MSSDSIGRVDRLISWIKRHRKDLVGEDGHVSAEKLAEATGKKPAYWSDVLRIRTSKKSFGDKAARAVEAKLDIYPLHLEGAGWPFEDVDQDRFERLTARQKGRVEQALIDALDKIEAEAQTKPRIANER